MTNYLLKIEVEDEQNRDLAGTFHITTTLVLLMETGTSSSIWIRGLCYSIDQDRVS